MGNSKDPGKTKLEKTSDTTFRVHAEDGSYFEGTYDPSQTKIKGDSQETGRYYYGNIKARNVMSNADRRANGMPQDEGLEDYQPDFEN